MDLATYAAVNGLSIPEAEEVLAAMFEPASPKVSPKVLSVLEALINKRPCDGRRSRVGAARSVPVAYTYR